MSINRVEQDYKDIQEKYGEFSFGERISEEELDGSLDVLPAHWIRTLRKHGRFSYRNGLIHVCGPNDLRQVLPLVFGDDLEFSHQNTVGIGYSAFGEIFVWHKEYGQGTINLYNGILRCDPLTSAEFSKGNERLILGVIYRNFEAYDTDGKPLFKRALKTLGELKWGEVYGFAPALALGGEEKLENLKIQPMLPHFAMVAQLQPFYLVDVQGPMPEQQIKVREIG